MNMEILSNLVITKIHSATTMYTSGGTRIKREGRPCWAIVHKFEGETVYTANGRTYVSDRTHLAILPKGCSYEWYCTRSGHYFIIEFDADAQGPDLLSLHTEDSDRIHTLCRSMEQKRLAKRPMWQTESIRDTYSILLLLTEEANKKYLPGEKKQKLLPALDYMTEHYNQPLSNDMLAELCGISTVYFRKLFTQS
ncbi:MAG: helix-turn-helix transcriptional regulator, partial [Clostridia bacterium]|nr:helix-turn-helix transcriptional regulator [Clostridia bacterium]